MDQCTRVCETCGERFTIPPSRLRHRAARFCSRACIRTDWQAARYTPCEQCGAPTRTFASRPRRFCSRACYEKAASAQVAKRCPVCGRRFTVPSSNADRFTVCSRACRTAHTAYASCKRCGRRFRVPRGRRRVYCSERCRRPPVHVSCEHCGASFRVTPSESAARRFCSLACWRRHSGETSLERLVREALEELGFPFEQELRVGRYSVDFALTTRGVALEVDGAYWHRDAARDRRKAKALERAGWRVVRLAEDTVVSAPSVVELVQAALRGPP